MTSDLPSLSLVAYRAAGTEKTYDGLLLEPGVHLRWAFHPNIGFPRHGFTIHRSLITQFEFEPDWSGWRRVAQVTLPIYDVDYYPAPGEPYPNEVEEAKRRLTSHPGGRYTELNNARLTDLVDTLHVVMDDEGPPAYTRPAAETNGKLSLRALDLLHLASVDPYIARVLGLYWVDVGGLGQGGDAQAESDEVTPGSPVAYKVVGDWGRDPWPEHVVTFDDIDTGEFRQGRISTEEVSLRTMRAITLLDDAGDVGSPRLQFTGYGDLPIRIVLPDPVQELRLDVEEESAPDGWRIDAENPDGFPVTVTTTRTTNGVFVRVEDDDVMGRVDLSQPDSGLVHITLNELGYRERLGEIGKQEAVAVLDPPEGMGVEKLRDEDPPRIRPDATVTEYRGSDPVPVPRIVRAESGTTPPGIDETGRVPESNASVELESFAPDAEEDSYRPVRLHVYRRRLLDSIRVGPGVDWPEIDPTTPESDRGSIIDGPIPSSLDRTLLTNPDPVLLPRSELVAAWTFDGTLTEKVTGSRTEQVGETEDDEPRYTLMDGDRKALELRDGRYLEVDTPTALESLGETLTIQMWIKPFSTDGFRTIVGNDWRQSFWLGLRPDSNQLRVWLRGSNGDEPIHSSGSVAEGRWTHVTVTYDGERVRFFIDGILDSTHVAPRGPIQSSSRDTLRIGADWGFFDEAAYFFDGALADLQILRYYRPKPAADSTGLAVALPFDGSTRERVTGTGGTTIGETDGFESGHPEDHTRSVLELSGDGFVQLEEHPSVVGDDSRQTVEAWVRPDHSQGSLTIVGNDEDRSFWFGLDIGGGGHVLRPSEVRVRFTMTPDIVDRSVSFRSDATIYPHRWTHVAVSYDGEFVRFYLDGVVDSVHEARYGPIQPNTDTALCIGADAGSTADDPRAPFSGGLADVRVWTEVPEQRPVQYHHGDLAGRWPLNGNLENVRTGNGATLRGQGEFVTGGRDDDEQQVLTLRGDGFVEVADQQAIQPVGSSLTIQALIRPVGGGAQTIVGNDYEQSFWLGVVKASTGYYLRAWINGTRFKSGGDALYRYRVQSSTTLPADRWSEVALSYDGSTVELFVNGDRTTRRASLDSIKSNPAETLCIGAESGSTPESVDFPFEGQLSEIRLWRSAVTPHEATDAIDDDAAPIHYEDREVPGGTYEYGVQGIDLFGRTSEWSSESIPVHDQLAPPVPTDVNARYLKLRGNVTENAEMITVDDEETRWRFPTDISVPDALVVHDDGTIPALARYDVRLRRPHDDTTDPQSIEIYAAERDGDRQIELETDRPLFAPFRPESDDEATIEFDLCVTLSWSWTGRQRLFWPRAREFRVYHEPRPLNTLAGTISAVEDLEEKERFRLTVTLEAPFSGLDDVPTSADVDDVTFSDMDNELADERCQIGSHTYHVRRNTTEGTDPVQIEVDVEYTNRPVIAPETDADFRIQLPPESSLYREYDDAANWSDRRLVEPIDEGEVYEIESVRTIPPELETDRTQDTVTHDWYRIPLHGEYSGSPVVVTAIQSFDGPNTAGTRIQNLTADGLEVQVEEEQSADDETKHTTEQIGYLALEPGNIDDGAGRRIGEAGTVTSDQPDGGTWHTVSLEHTYDDPVVFMQISTYNGSQPAHARVRDVGRDTFRYQIEEWDYLDQRHTTEAISYVVLERGTHRLVDGTVMDVGTVDSAHNWTEVQIDQDVRDSTANPVVFSQSQTYNGPQAVVTRHRNVKTSRFELRLQEEEANDDRHAVETIGYVALASGSVHRVELSEIDLPDVEQDEYVPGALVGLDDSRSPPTWQVFDVVGQESRSAGGSTLYIRVDGDEVTVAEPRELHRLRYYPGQRYRTTLDAPIEFASETVEDPLVRPPPGTPQVEQTFGVTTADGREATADHRDDPDRFGNESGVSRPVSVVAVDRRRPQPPPRPTVDIGRADYYDDATAAVEWSGDGEPGEGVQYNVYRAVDSAIFTRDMEQRRRKTGPYANFDGARRLSDPFMDAEDVRAWLETHYPDKVSDEGGGRRIDASLFPHPEKEKEQYEAVTPIWRAWSEWYYPGLRDAEVRELADLAGNDEAFALVTESPVSKPEYTDTVPGDVRNRYLYRIESISPSLARSFGQASAPEQPTQTRPPRTPRFTAVEPGDRQVTLRWTLDYNPNVAEYRIFRAQVPSAGGEDAIEAAKQRVDDLRHWTADYRDDDRWVATVPDPLLRVRDGTPEGEEESDEATMRLLDLELPDGLDARVVEAVYPVREFDRSRDPVTDQPDLVNLLAERPWTPDDETADKLTIEELRWVAEGTAVAVVVRDAAGERHVLDRATTTVEHRTPDGTTTTYQIQPHARRPLTVERGTVHVSEELSDVDILGVFRMAEFDETRDPLDDQPDASNLYQEESRHEVVAGSDVLTGLSPVEDGTRVVVVIQDDGETRALTDRRVPLGGEFVDQSLLGMTDYVYRLQAVGKGGASSEGSEVKRVRPLELTPPPAPSVTPTRTEAGDEDSVTLEIETDPRFKIMIQRRPPRASLWQTIEHEMDDGTVDKWADADEVPTWSETVSPAKNVEYRVWCRTPGGRTCDRPEPILVEPPDGGSS